MELHLILRENNRERARHTLASGEYVIGRDQACEVVIASDAVSRRHARLTVSHSSVYVEDLGSANGTFVQGRRAEGRVLVPPGHRLEIGHVMMEAHWLPDAAATVVDTVEEEGPRTAEEFLQGTKYDLGNVVAAGGMGVIRRARDRRVRRSVAMKLMSPAAVDTPAKRMRFVEEAQVTGQLEHPNIVPVYDLGMDEMGEPYYTMKFVRGIDLKVVIDDIAQGKKDTISQFPLSRLLTIFQKACDAISFAHSKGVIHRDLKPENIMIGDFGEVLVMDWGLAKTLSHKTTELPNETSNIESARHLASAHHTLDGSVLGTPHFMSPEQAAGKIDQLDARTDIFALGGLLYSILTLHPPFPGDTAEEALNRIRSGTITPPMEFNQSQPGRPRLKHCPDRRIPGSLGAVTMKALSIDPADRYQTVRELQKDIEAYQGGFATTAEDAGTVKQLTLLFKRRQVEFTMLGVALLAVLAVGASALTRIISSEHTARESLEKLRNAAPAYASQAESLIKEQKFSMALGKIDTALELRTNDARYLVVKGHLLESLLRLPEAKEAYARALEVEPQNASAKENLALCDKLLAAAGNADELPPPVLDELQAAMLHQERSAEALAMVQKLGDKEKKLFATWRTILEGEGLIEKNKNTTRLIINGGQFNLDLSFTKIEDLSILKGMPIQKLNLIGTPVRDLSPLKDTPLTVLNLTGTLIRDLEPLRGMPLKDLQLAGCKSLSDVKPLCDCTNLEVVLLPFEATNLDCLRKSLPKLARIGSPPRIPTPEEYQRPRPPGVRLPYEETLSAADFWKMYDKLHK